MRLFGIHETERSGTIMTRRSHQRRGVLLLIVLSLLVLFVLIGVTFVVVAGQYTKAAKSYARHEITGDPPDQELDRALMLLLRGSNDVTNPTHRHNLLGDLYGHRDGVRGVIEEVVAVTDVDFSGNEQVSDVLQIIPAGEVSRDIRDEHYAGRLFTLIDGEGIGHTTRILSSKVIFNYNLTGENTVILYVRAFDKRNQVGGMFLPRPGVSFVINGRPLNGPGRGYEPNAAGNSFDEQTHSLQTTYSMSLLPFTFTESNLQLMARRDTVLGDDDEGYDVADYQNMFLARIPSTSFVNFNRENPLIPSFHRPYLVNYWMTRLENDFTETLGTTGGTSSIEPINLRRAIIARPLPIDHPFFTGSNPVFTDRFLLQQQDNQGNTPDDGVFDGLNWNPDTDNFSQSPLVRGPWDVDNDHDGIPDSIWVDLGAPIKVAEDGRRYKPLFAILCQDMDGRINLNAHGSLDAILADHNYTTFIQNTIAGNAAGATTGVSGVEFTMTPQLSTGLGFGPAEIRLDEVVDTYLNTTAAPLFDGTNRDPLTPSILRYRYQSQLWTEPFDLPMPGNVNPNQQDPLSRRQLWGLPTVVDTGSGTLTTISTQHYLSPPDLSGVGGVLLDHTGQPIYIRNLGNQGGQYPYLADYSFGGIINNPYESNLVSPNGSDNLLSASDLETLLRFGDEDTLHSNSPLTSEQFGPNKSASRYLNATGRMSPVKRALELINIDNLTVEQLEQFELFSRVVTTHSFDLPVPKVPGKGLADLAWERLAQTDTEPAGGPGSTAWENWRHRMHIKLALALPPEVIRGERFDINRLFGNGVDDNSNGIIDDPTENENVVPNINDGTPHLGRFNFPPDLPKTWFRDSNGDPFLVNQRYWHPNADLASDDFRQNLNAEWYVLEAYDNDLQAAGVTITEVQAAYQISYARWFSRQQYARWLFCMMILTLEENTGGTVDKEVARRVAQWAVNVVDFRDPDAAMTPFEFDPRPFDARGWEVDDRYLTGSGDGMYDTRERQVVWGCESPDLIITESFALHDRRVADAFVGPDASTHYRLPERHMNNDTMDDDTDLVDRTPPMGHENDQVDPTLDQVRVPQGSLFLELYATGNRHNPFPPSELYSNGQLVLDKTAGPDNDPVWRVAFMIPDHDSDNHERQASITSSLLFPLSEHANPEQANPQEDGNNSSVDDEQIVYEMGLPRDVTIDQDTGLAIDPESGSPSTAIDPGTGLHRNAIHPITGLPNDVRVDSGGMPVMDSYGRPEKIYDRYIYFTANLPADAEEEDYLRAYRNMNDRIASNEPGTVVPDNLLSPGQFAVIAPRITTHLGAKDTRNSRIRAATYSFDLADQTLGFKDPTNLAANIDLTRLVHTDAQGMVIPPSFQDPELCIVAGALPVTGSVWSAPNTSGNDDNPLYGIGINISEPNPGTGYYVAPDTDVNEAELQYTPAKDLPADSIPGIGRPLAEERTYENVPESQQNHLVSGVQLGFRAALLQRLADPTQPFDELANPYVTVDSHLIDLNVFNGQEDKARSLFGSNAAAPDGGGDGSTSFPGWEDDANPYRDTEYDMDDPRDVASDAEFEAQPPDDGQPRQLTGTPREFNRFLAYEVTAAQVQGYFGSRQRGASTGTSVDWLWRPHGRLPNRSTLPLSGTLGSDAWRIQARHTLGGLNSNLTAVSSPANNNYAGSPNEPLPWITWHNRPFANPMELMLVPTSAPWRLPFEMRRLSDDPVTIRARHVHLMNFAYEGLYSVFDWLHVPSRFAGSEEWVYDFGGVNAVFSPPSGSNIVLPYDWTAYEAPFNKISAMRDPGKVNINTIADAVVWNAIVDESQTPWGTVVNQMRGDASDPAYYTNPFRSAAAAPVTASQVPSEADEITLLHGLTDGNLLFDNATTAPATDATRHPYFELAKLIQSGNKLTTSSNVFGVWITVGYFEVLPWDPNPNDTIPGPIADDEHPDGYQFGQEIGIDTGEVERHRAFYIIDRSIPVGFERGQDHNVEDTILLRRYLE